MPTDVFAACEERTIGSPARSPLLAIPSSWLVRRSPVAGVVLAWLVVLPGCGPGRPPIGTARGTVTTAGKAVTGCSVMFQPEGSGPMVAAALDTNGRYEVRTYLDKGLLPGRYRVFILPGTGAVDDLPTEDKRPLQPLTAIPERFRSAKTSGLVIDVRVGQNPDFNFDLRP